MSIFTSILKERDLRPPLLYGISHRKLFPRLDAFRYLELLFRTSAHFIQWREKDLDREQNRPLVRRGVELGRSTGKVFVVNADFPLAVSEGADGVHLASHQNFPDPVELKRRATDRRPFLVGYSAHSEREAKRGHDGGADYLFLSPVRAPLSKPAEGPVLGFEELRRIVSVIPIPVFALGGIAPSDGGEMIRAGVVGVAGIDWVHRELAALL